jgi:hypothetical protein
MDKQEIRVFSALCTRSLSRGTWGTRAGQWWLRLLLHLPPGQMGLGTHARRRHVGTGQCQSQPSPLCCRDRRLGHCRRRRRRRSRRSSRSSQSSRSRVRAATQDAISDQQETLGGATTTNAHQAIRLTAVAKFGVRCRHSCRGQGRGGGCRCRRQGRHGGRGGGHGGGFGQCWGCGWRGVAV